MNYSTPNPPVNREIREPGNNEHITIGKVKLDYIDWLQYFTLSDWKIRDGYLLSKPGSISLAKLILQDMCGPTSLVPDHINFDRLDNRRCNLRPLTRRGNSPMRTFPESEDLTASSIPEMLEQIEDREFHRELNRALNRYERLLGK